MRTKLSIQTKYLSLLSEPPFFLLEKRREKIETKKNLRVADDDQKIKLTSIYPSSHYKRCFFGKFKNEEGFKERSEED